MWWIYTVCCVIMIAIDQITKRIAVLKLRPIENITVIDGILDFSFVENRGAAFGILSGRRWFFVVLTAIIAIAIIWAFIKVPKNKIYNLLRVSLILVLAGAIGNLIDRIFNGYVVDFLEVTFISWPVFNIADIYVVVGTIMLAVILIFFIKEEPFSEGSEKGS